MDIIAEYTANIRRIDAYDHTETAMKHANTHLVDLLKADKTLLKHLALEYIRDEAAQRAEKERRDNEERARRLQAELDEQARRDAEARQRLIDLAAQQEPAQQYQGWGAGGGAFS